MKKDFFLLFGGKRVIAKLIRGNFYTVWSFQFFFFKLKFWRKTWKNCHPTINQWYMLWSLDHIHWLRNWCKVISANIWISWESSEEVLTKVLRKSWESPEKVLRKYWESFEKFLYRTVKKKSRETFRILYRLIEQDQELGKNGLNIESVIHFITFANNKICCIEVKRMAFG